MLAIKCKQTKTREFQLSSMGERCSHCEVTKSEGCTARDRLKRALHTYFKYTEFRPGQVESTVPAMHGRDVFVRMATGSGKSLCMFLVPLAVSDSGMGVVISPLNALMDQQVRIYRVLLVSLIVDAS